MAPSLPVVLGPAKRRCTRTPRPEVAVWVHRGPSVHPVGCTWCTWIQALSPPPPLVLCHREVPIDRDCTRTVQWGAGVVRASAVPAAPRMSQHQQHHRHAMPPCTRPRSEVASDRGRTRRRPASLERQALSRRGPRTAFRRARAATWTPRR